MRPISSGAWIDPLHRSGRSRRAHAQLRNRNLPIAAGGERPLSTLVSTDLPTLRGESSAAAAARHPGWDMADALPVVDPGGRFAGALSLRTLYQRLAAPSGSLGAATSGQETIGALSELLTLAWGGVLGTLAHNRE